MKQKISSRYGPYVLIIGASEGIGFAFARLACFSGLVPVLTARRENLLQESAAKLEAEFGVRPVIVPADITKASDMERLIWETASYEIGLLVYNAALSYIGKFENRPVEEHLDMLQGNAMSQLRLVHHFGKQMLERKRGGMVLMSSMAGLQGSGYLSTYAATKAFNRILGESLWFEWKPKGVDVLACCAGATATPGYLDSAPAKGNIFRPRVQDPMEVAEKSIRCLGQKPVIVTGPGNRFGDFIMHRILGRKAAIRLMGKNTLEMYREKLR